MSLFPSVQIFTTIYFYHIVEYDYNWPIETLIYIFWANFGQVIMIYNYHYSDSVSWWPKNSRKMALSPSIWIITTILLPYFRVWTTWSHRALNIYILGSIITAKLFHISHFSDSVYWNRKIVKKLLQICKYEELPQFFLTIL